MAKKDPLARRLWHPIYRTLRVDILTLFLSLFIVSFTFVIFFTYIKGEKAIETFSLGTVSRASSIILEKVKALISDANRFPKITDSIIWEEKDILEDNDDLILYLLRVVQLETDFSHIFVASTTGRFISASDLHLSTQNSYMTNPSKLLPENARFSLFYVDASTQPHKNIWYYLDENLQTICYEESSGDEFDPTTRPWYEGAIEAKGLYWSRIFTYFATGDTGISVSQPLYDKNGKIIGVTGVEISFALLSSFLSRQQVGKTGQVFLLNSTGEALFSHRGPKGVHDTISHDTLTEAYRYYSTDHKASFTFENKGIKYLAYVDQVPVISGKHWLIMIIVPHSDFFAEITQMEELVSLITCGVLLLSGLLVFYFSKRISSPIVTLSKEVDRITHLDLTSEARVRSNIKEIILIDESIAAMRTGLRSFARYVPRRVVQKLIEKKEEITLGGEKKKITVFFSDIAGFTSFSEEHSTEVVMALLSEYFDELSKIILKEEGTIDKYIGDSIMAFWGAPMEISDHAAKACRAALYCQAFLEKFNIRQRQKGQKEMLTRIAINTGMAIVGNIGTLERMNYTVIGDVVNTAAHLQTVNKVYHTQTIITEETYKQCTDAFLVRPLDIIVPSGKKTKIKIYELIGFLKGDAENLATEGQKELCALFTAGFEAFHSGAIQQAQILFSKIQKKFPQDFPTQLYLDRITKQV